MDGFLHQASFVTGNWCYDRHCSVRLVICFDLAIDQIAQSGLSSLKVIYYSAQLFSAYADLAGRVNINEYNNNYLTAQFEELSQRDMKKYLGEMKRLADGEK